MSELDEKIKVSIERIQSFEDLTHRFADDGADGYYLAFSGGKDSVVVKRLMDMAGVKYDAHYRLTSVDPPELVRFIREKHPDVSVDVPRYPEEYKNPRLAGKPVTMWNLIPEKGIPPTRRIRYCCEWLKESGGDGRMAVTGVRWAESSARKNQRDIIDIQDGGKIAQESEHFDVKRGSSVLINDNDESRQMLDACVTRHKTCLNPIIDWTDRDVWDFIRTEKIPYCELYDEGHHRLGCIGCLMARQHGREREFARWPEYKAAYLCTFLQMLKRREEHGLPNARWPDETAVYNWWMAYDVLPGQIDLLAEEYEEEDEL